MKIETKYNIGQKVWFMWDNKATQREIIGVAVHIEGDLQAEEYEVEHLEGEDGVLYGLTLKLEDLFPTKEELIKSL